MRDRNLLTHRVHTRITSAKFDELNGILSRSLGIKSLSELLRNILDNKKIIVVTYDTSHDKVMAELSAIRMEIQAIGININQVTRRFHSEQYPEARLFEALELAKLYQQTDRKVTELFEVIANLSRKWLPGS